MNNSNMLLLLLSILISGTTNGKIVIKTEDQLSLSKEEFKEIIDYSLQHSTCCNVFINEYKNTTDKLSLEFMKIYSLKNTITSSTYKCNGYFLYGKDHETLASIIQRIPVKNFTTEILIMTDTHLTTNSRLFNSNLYEYANVNIVSRFKHWTLSENFWEHRKFRQILGNIDIAHKNRMIDIERRQLQVATFYIPPLSYLSTSINETVNGIEGEFFLTNDTTEWDGVEVKLFLIMAEKLNFTYLIRKPNCGYRYGRAGNNTWHGGMIGQIWRKEIDLAFGGIWLQADAYRFVNLSAPWYQVSINFLVPRPKPIVNIWAIIRPLNTHVWLVIISLVFIQSLNIWLKAKMKSNIPSRFKNYSNTLIELIGRFVGASAPAQTRGIRMQLNLWHIAGLLIITFYCSSLAARLTTPDYEPRIDTSEDFLQTNMTWGREGPTPKFHDYFNEKIVDKMQSRFYGENSEVERREKITRGNYAVIGRIIDSIFFPENNIDSAQLRNYRVMRESFGKYYISFATRPWLVKSIDMMTHRLMEHGFTTYHLRDVINRRTSTSLREVLVEHDGENIETKALMLKPLSAGFILLFTGNLLAIIVFCLELQYEKFDKTINDRMKSIKTYRTNVQSWKLVKIFYNCKNNIIGK